MVNVFYVRETAKLAIVLLYVLVASATIWLFQVANASYAAL